MDQIKSLINGLIDQTSLTYDRLPDIDLYMDHRISFAQQLFGAGKRQDIPGDDKQLYKGRASSPRKRQEILPRASCLPADDRAPEADPVGKGYRASSEIRHRGRQY